MRDILGLTLLAFAATNTFCFIHTIKYNILIHYSLSCISVCLYVCLSVPHVCKYMCVSQLHFGKIPVHLVSSFSSYIVFLLFVLRAFFNMYNKYKSLTFETLKHFLQTCAVTSS